MFATDLGVTISQQDIDLIFGCGIDQYSELEIIDELSFINHLVDNLIQNILDAKLTSRSQSPSESNVDPTANEPIWSLFSDCGITEGNVREFIVDFFFHDILLTTIHSHYFDGNLFTQLGRKPSGAFWIMF